MDENIDRKQSNNRMNRIAALSGHSRLCRRCARLAAGTSPRMLRAPFTHVGAKWTFGTSTESSQTRQARSSSGALYAGMIYEAADRMHAVFSGER